MLIIFNRHNRSIKLFKTTFPSCFYYT
jgi:hypothetical protein